MPEHSTSQGLLLRLPLSLRAQAAELAHAQGTSLNYFIITALQERIDKEHKRNAGKEEHTVEGVSDKSSQSDSAM